MNDALLEVLGAEDLTPLPFHQGPDTLDWIQFAAVGGKILDEVLLLPKPCSDVLCMVCPVIVHDEDGGARVPAVGMDPALQEV